MPDESVDAARDPSGSLAGNSMAHAGWTIVSRATGLGRVAVIGAVLGPSYLGNTFLATNLVPNLTYELLTGSLFASLLVPPLVRKVDGRNRAEVERLAGGFLGVALVVFLGVILLVILGGPLVLRLLAVGVTDLAVAEAQQRVGWLLLALLMPQVALYGIAGTASAVLNAHGRFALPAAAPVLENVGVVVTLLVYAALYGSGADITEIENGPLWLLGTGTTLSVGLHAAVAWLGARRVGVTLVPRAGWRDPEVRAIVSRAVPSLGYAGANALRQFTVLVVANRVPGGVVAFQLALNFYHLPVAIGARPVAVALLPPLTRRHDGGDHDGFSALFSRGLSLVCVLTVPAALAFIVLREHLAAAIAFGEMTQGPGTRLLAAALGALAVGVVAEGVFVLATNGSYARRDARSPFTAMIWRTAISVAGMAATFALGGSAAIMYGIGAAITGGNLVAAWLLIRRVGGARWRQIGPAVTRTTLASMIMIVPAYVTAVAVRDWTGGVDLLAAASAGLIGIAVFVVAMRALRSPDVTFFLEDLRANRRSPSASDR